MNLNRLQIRGGKHGTAVVGDRSLTLTASAKTDWFHHPADRFRQNDVLSLATEVAEETFAVTARVSVESSRRPTTQAQFFCRSMTTIGQSWRLNTRLPRSQQS